MWTIQSLLEPRCSITATARRAHLVTQKCSKNQGDEKMKDKQRWSREIMSRGADRLTGNVWRHEYSDFVIMKPFKDLLVAEWDGKWIFPFYSFVLTDESYFSLQELFYFLFLRAGETEHNQPVRAWELGFNLRTKWLIFDLWVCVYVCMYVDEGQLWHKELFIDSVRLSGIRAPMWTQRTDQVKWKQAPKWWKPNTIRRNPISRLGRKQVKKDTSHNN